MPKQSSTHESLTLHGKVDIPEEASLPWGVEDVQEEKSKTFHGRVQSRDGETGEARRIEGNTVTHKGIKEVIQRMHEPEFSADRSVLQLILAPEWAT